MKITIKQNRDIKLKLPTFLCDYELKKDVPEPYNLLVSGYKFITIIGKPASGKTSVLFSLFDKKILKKAFNNVILVMPRHSFNSIARKTNVFRDLADEKLFDDIADIGTIQEQIKYYSDEGENTCLIIDDQTAKLKDSYIANALSDIIYNRRHYKCSIILLAQVYERIPLQIRKNINILIVLFKPAKKEIVKIVEESLEMKEPHAIEIMKLLSKPFDRLLVDLTSQRMFINCNEIFFTEE